MTKRLLILPLGVTMCLLGTSVPARAGTFTFNFNNLNSGDNSGTIASKMQTYMQGILVGSTVSATPGAVVADQAYNGDGHVVGFGAVGTANVKSLTLGTSDGDPTTTGTQHVGSYDTFIRNVTPTFTGWSFVFGGILIDRVSFDYEIFPDGNCPSMANCTSQPDMTFQYTNATTTTTVFNYLGTTPSLTNYKESPCTSGGGGVSCAGTTEAAPQKIGNTGFLNLTNATTLTFLDWPAMVGIDNLIVEYHTPPVGTAAVPEPGTMLLVGSGLAAAYARRKKRHA